MSGFNDGLKKPSSGGGGGGGAETVDGVAGEAIALGEVCMLSFGAGTTAGKVYLADADNGYSSTGAAILGLCTSAAASDGDAVTIQTGGLVDGSGLSGLTSGKVYGLSSTPGALALTASIPWIGIAESASSLRLSGVYTTTGLTAGEAWGSNASGVLTEGLAESIGYAVSTTELQLRARFGATGPTTSQYSGPAPVAYYRCNEASGTTVTDVGENTLGASTVGDVTFSSDATFPGGTRNIMTIAGASGGGFVTPTLPAGSPTQTYSFWAQATETPDSFWVYIGITNSQLVGIHYAATGDPLTWYDDSASSAYNDAGTAFGSSWAHWTLTKSASQARIYRNGVLDGGPFSIGSTTRATTLHICKASFGTASQYVPHSKICEIFIVDAELTAAQVAEVYNASQGAGPIWSS